MVTFDKGLLWIFVDKIYLAANVAETQVCEPLPKC